MSRLLRYHPHLRPHARVEVEVRSLTYAHLGHSERRTLFNETSQLVADKTRAAIDAGLSVILCVGETLEEREANKTKEVVEAQLKPVVAALKESDWRCVPSPLSLQLNV